MCKVQSGVVLGIGTFRLRLAHGSCFILSRVWMSVFVGIFRVYYIYILRSIYLSFMAKERGWSEIYFMFDAVILLQ